MIRKIADMASIREAAGVLRAGGLVAMPTETVYGLGADAFNPAAVAKIFDVKNRPSFDPLIVHIADYSQLVRVAGDLDPELYQVVKQFWPGPLTVVMKKSAEIPEIVTAGLATVAVRMPSHPVARDLIRESGTAIAAPSANPFGYLSPTQADHVERQLGSSVEYILDGGSCSVGLESTIIMKEEGRWYLLRHGGLEQAKIEKVTGKLENRLSAGENPDAPGQLPWHYSPQTPVIIFSEPAEIVPREDAAYLFFNEVPLAFSGCQCRLLTPENDLTLAASRLFESLHALDDLRKENIYIQKVPETGLGLAIMDRVRKAAGRPGTRP